MSLAPDTDECDPPTDAMGALDRVTTAGTAATLQLHHLHGLLTALGPLRATYASAAVDRLRALPLDARRAVLPHLLHEHPGLTREPRVRALADEVLLDPEAGADRPDVVRWLARVSGVRAHDAADALDRVEHALVALASGVAELAARRAEMTSGLVHSATASLHEGAAEVLASALVTPSDRPAWSDELAPLMSALASHSSAVVRAAREAAHEVIASEDVEAVEARAKIPRWWPSPFREAALWSRAVAESRARHERLRTRAAAFDAAFARAYVAQVDAQRE